MAFEVFLETEEHYYLQFEPPLSEEQLSQLPNPYWGRTRNRTPGDCSEIAASGWPYSALVEMEKTSETVLALDKHSLRLAALSGLNIPERAQVIQQIEKIEHFSLMDYLGKISHFSDAFDEPRIAS
jgi:hypothetical protein